MATVYRDYGAIDNNNPPNNAIATVPHRQVYLATHEGDETLPFMKRSFISFSFGHRKDKYGTDKPVKIEDFNLIATTVSNSLNRTGSAAFEDIVSSYNNLEGQQYWNTHYKTNTLDFVLVTDGMDQRMLDDFLYWFHAGEAKELILAEHPNRGILARVAQPPQLDLLPFEEPIEVMISGYTYPTSTTLYKGTIHLSLVMDNPHWYSVTNILGVKDGDRYLNVWTDFNGNQVNIFTSKDALKILYEDGIPLGSMIAHNMLLGNGAFANVDENVISNVWSIANDDDIEWSGESWGNGEPSGEGARVEANDAVAPYSFGIIAGAIIEADGNGIVTLSKASASDLERNRNVGFFYYSGTAPAPTIISFTLTPSGDSDGYIKVPANSYVKNVDLEGTENAYDILTIECRDKLQLCFTTPNIYTSFNKVIDIFNTCVTTGTTKSFVDIRKKIMEEVHHRFVREWATYILDEHKNDTLNNTLRNTLRTEMWNFLKSSSDVVLPATFVFNSETGEAKGYFRYRLAANDDVISTPVEEDVGDMLRSNYIIIRDRNYTTENGAVDSWTNIHPEYSHRIYHTALAPLKSVQIMYKNMYL